MVQHARANDEIETLVQVADVLDRHLPRFEIRQVVLLLSAPRCARDLSG